MDAKIALMKTLEAIIKKGDCLNVGISLQRIAGKRPRLALISGVKHGSLQ